MEETIKIDKHTYLSLALVITMLGAAFSFGIMYQKIDDMDNRLVRVENKIDAYIGPRSSDISSAGGTALISSFSSL